MGVRLQGLGSEQTNGFTMRAEGFKLEAGRLRCLVFPLCLMVVVACLLVAGHFYFIFLLFCVCVCVSSGKISSSLSGLFPTFSARPEAENRGHGG